MLLKHVSIENFRGISSLSLELGEVTVVVGENNHGKTSLFDVLDRCLGVTADGEAPAWEYRDFRREGGKVVGPIRVVLSFERGGGPTTGSLSELLFESAICAEPTEGPCLSVAFTGHPESGAMEVAFLDGEDRPLDVAAPDTLLRRLRQLHPVFVVRLNQPPPDTELEWVSHEDRRDFDPTRGDDPFEAISQVYHRLTRTRGTVPTEEVRRGLQAARQLQARMEGEDPARAGAMGRMLDRFLADATGEGPTPMTGGGSHSLGLLMVLGALLDVRGGTRLEENARPIIAIEEPEVHLHPMLLSSTWDVIESLQSQTLVTTNSGEFLSQVPLSYLRRLVRRHDRIESYRLLDDTLTPDSLRRVGYHIRARRGGTLFARCWLLVEGETEFWLLTHLATVLGFDLDAEGVRCVEFAQCGVAPLVRLANDLGIAWHLLSDGDESGVAFANRAASQLQRGSRKEHVTRLRRRDMEMTLWHEGFADVYQAAAGIDPPPPGSEEERHLSARKVVARAIRAHSKPYLALLVAEECARRGPESVPPALRHVIETAVGLARDAVENGA